MKYPTTIGTILILFSISLVENAYGQTVQVGIVKDARTLRPISSVHITTPERGTYSDDLGNFAIPVTSDDSLRVSHVSYIEASVAITDDTLMVFLEPSMYRLSNVEVYGLSDEQRFKKNLLRLYLPPALLEARAKENVAQAHRLFLSGYVPTMNSEDNYFTYMSGPQGATIISTNSSQGITQAFRNIGVNRRLLRPTHMKPTQLYRPVFINPVSNSTATDTVRRTIEYQ